MLVLLLVLLSVLVLLGDESSELPGLAEKRQRDGKAKNQERKGESGKTPRRVSVWRIFFFLQDGSEKKSSTRQTESSAQVLVTVNGPTGGSTLSRSLSNLLQVQVLILSQCFLSFRRIQIIRTR